MIRKQKLSSVFAIAALIAASLVTANIAVAETSGNSANSAKDVSSVAGIRGSGVRGIRGSGVRGIRGSGVRGIRGSGVRGIRGSGVRGIRGSGVRGIRGSGVRGIRGSGVRGIRGSGLRANEGDALNPDLQLLAIGAASVNAENGALSVIGQQIVLDDVTEVINLATGGGTLPNGARVAVSGELMDAGQILATEIVVLSDEFVHGADSVYLKTIVESADSATANAQSGATSIDYSAALGSSATFNPTQGDVAEFAGITSADFPARVYAQTADLAKD